MGYADEQWEKSKDRRCSEENEKKGEMYGYSDNYLRISATYNEKLINKIIKVKVKEPKNNY